VEEKHRKHYPVTLFQSVNVTLAVNCIVKNVVAEVVPNVVLRVRPMQEKFMLDYQLWSIVGSRICALQYVTKTT